MGASGSLNTQCLEKCAHALNVIVFVAVCGVNTVFVTTKTGSSMPPRSTELTSSKLRCIIAIYDLLLRPSAACVCVYAGHLKVLPIPACAKGLVGKLIPGSRYV